MLVAILISMTVTAAAIMLAFPKTPAARWLQRILVDPPARFLVDFTWMKLGRALLVGFAILLFALASPEMLAVLVAMGMDAAMVEVMLVVWVASVSGGFVNVWRGISRLASTAVRLVRAIATPRNRARTSRRRKHRPQRKTDDQEPAWAFA